MSVNTYRVLSALILLVFIASILPPIASAAAPGQETPPAEIWRAKFHPVFLKKIEGLGDDHYVTAMIMLKPLPPDLRKAVKGNHDLAVKALKEWARATQDPIIRKINSMHGIVLNRFWLGNMILVKAPLKTLKIVAADTFVVQIVENFKVTVNEPVAKHRVDARQEVSSWGIFKIRAPDAWSLGYLGEEIRIAVLDTGVDISHPALQGKMLTLDPSSPYYPGGWMEWDENGNPVLSQPHDTHGHGTHTSGTALGGDTENILIGVAPHATLMHGLVLPSGSGTFAQVVAGMEWTVDPYYLDPDTGQPVPTGLPAHVVSMSWGASGYYQNDLLPPIEDMLLANIIPVAAIGNDGPGTSSNPGNIWGAFGVGATDINDNVAYFSSGEVVNWPSPPSEWPFFDTYPSTYIKPDFSAPGVSITSAVPGGGYEAWDGTSMATPHVSGTVALVLQAAGWTDYNIEDLPEMVYTILNESAVDLGDPGQDIRYGWGRIDAYEAVQIAQQYAKKTGVEGWVLDAETGEGVAWAKVTVLEINKTYSVNASGYFRIPLDPGNYTLQITAWGYVTQTVPVVVLPPGNGTVTGTVYDAVTLAPIAGATIYVQELNITVTTDSAGHYSISMPEGVYHLVASAPGYHEETATVQVVSNTTVVQDFYLMPVENATVFGFVYDATTEEPIEGAVVIAIPGNYTATTDFTGYYELSLPPGTYTLIAYASGYSPAYANITVTEGAMVEQDFGLFPAGNGTVYGYVVNETGAPIANATVTIVELGISNTTDASGYYMIKDVPAGVYTIRASATGYMPSTTGVIVLPDQWVEVNFTLVKTRPTIAIVGDYEPAPVENMTDIQYLLVSAGFQVEVFYSWVDLMASIENGSTYAAVVINKWGPPSPNATTIVEFLQLLDENNIPAIWLDTWTSADSGVFWLYEYNAEVSEAGYPAPLDRTQHYPDPDKVTIKMLDLSHPIFSGVVPDVPPDQYYPATLDSGEIDYAVYTEWSTNVTVLGELIDTSFNVNGTSIVEWTAPGGEKWIFISYGASYWLRYTSMDYGMFSNNSARVLINAISYVSGVSPSSLSLLGGVSGKAYTEVTIYLQRQPYGWVTGQVVDTEGNPIAGAKVVVVGTPVSTTTGDDGTFMFWLPVGTYTIVISAFGYYTQTLNVTVTEGETTDLGQIPLQRMPRAAILYDYNGEISTFLSYLGILGVDYNDLSTLLDDLQPGVYDLVIWSGFYGVPMPPQDQVDQLVEAIEEQGISLILLDQWGSNYGYGINTFHTYYGDPASRGYGYGDGLVYIRVDMAHPIFYGYEVGDVIQIFTGSDEDYSFFAGYSGTSIGSLIVGSTYKGDAIAYKVSDTGAKYILMASFAPESYTPMEHWTEDAFTIFANAVFWAMLKPLHVSVSPTAGHVGDTVSVTVSDSLEPGSTIYVFFDDMLLMALTVGSDGTATGEFTVPLVPGGDHVVSAITADGTRYGMATFTVLAKIEAYPTEIVAPGVVHVVGTGLPASMPIDVYLELNWLSTITTNSSGAFEGDLIIPLVPTGTFNLKLVSEGETLYSTPITVTSRLDNLTVIANVSVDLTEVLNMLGDISSKIDMVNTQLDTVSGTLTDISNQLNNIRGVLTTISGDTAQIKTSIGEISMKLDELNASLEALIETDNGIYAVLNTSIGQVIAKLDTVLSNLDSLGVSADQITSMLAALGSNMTQYYDNIMNKLEEISGSVSSLSTNLQNLSSTVDQLATKIDTAKKTAEEAKNSAGSTASISYAATGLSVIALLAALAMFFRKP